MDLVLCSVALEYIILSMIEVKCWDLPQRHCPVSGSALSFGRMTTKYYCHSQEVQNASAMSCQSIQLHYLVSFLLSCTRQCRLQYCTANPVPSTVRMYVRYCPVPGSVEAFSCPRQICDVPILSFLSYKYIVCLAPVAEAYTTPPNSKASSRVLYMYFSCMAGWPLGQRDAHRRVAYVGAPTHAQ